MKYLKYTGVLAILLLASCEEVAFDADLKNAELNVPVATVSPVWPFIDENESSRISADLLRKNIYIVFDGSGSMADRDCSGGSPKINVARTAFKDFLGNVPKDANVGLHIFDRQGNREVVSLGINNRDSLSEAINSVVPRSGTPLGPAIKSAYRQMTAQAKNQLGYGEYHLVVITDGIANSGQESGAIVETILSESPVIMHTIGFCIGTRHALNKPGQVFYKAADDRESLVVGLQGVLAESPDYAVVNFQ
ncbi:hypothetical protein MNBD_GAMMA21-2425 [hydrothermal vent metagenome]|uniref:VWFA domain-containing protein n=1 Tax=hydrothermal vent metagenome TaxID=652676 RepID=A0A3B1B4G8_9ZZZZ